MGRGCQPVTQRPHYGVLRTPDRNVVWWLCLEGLQVVSGCMQCGRAGRSSCICCCQTSWWVLRSSQTPPACCLMMNKPCAKLTAGRACNICASSTQTGGWWLSNKRLHAHHSAPAVMSKHAPDPPHREGAQPTAVQTCPHDASLPVLLHPHLLLYYLLIALWGALYCPSTAGRRPVAEMQPSNNMQS